MVQVASLLLIYLKPAEVYHVLAELVTTSQDMFKRVETQALLRWHFTFERAQYFKLLGTFVRSYMDTTMRKKRSLLLHFNKINFDFTRFVDTAFKSLLTYFVPLPVAVEVLMMFLVEGNKILFRYTYALLKCNKKFIKAATNGQDLLD